MNDARDQVRARASCYGCDVEIVLVDATWSTKRKRWEGGQWVHHELPELVHPAHPATKVSA